MKAIFVFVVLASLLGFASGAHATGQITEPAIDNPTPPDPTPRYTKPVVKAPTPPDNTR
jgi:hypothetical protein